MKIVHRIGTSADAVRQEQLKMLGVTGISVIPTLMPDKETMIAFDIEESHHNWLAVKDLVEQWGCSDVPRIVFSKDEITAAPWLSLRAWNHDYPQPEDGNYRHVTFDVSNWCQKCGVGLVQKAPFRMTAEPRWGKHTMLQLFWVFDELFVTPQLWKAVFHQRRINCRPVSDTRGAELQTVVQIVIDHEVGMNVEGIEFEVCSACRRIKYQMTPSCARPSLAEAPNRPIARTREYFGYGGQADRRVIVSQELVRALEATKVRGIQLEPLHVSVTSRDTFS